MNLRVGTSGFAYPQWKGRWYPADLGDDAMLASYATRLATVEINNTFYRMPKPAVLEAWRAQVPATFTFVLKVSRRVTHQAKLKPPEAPDSMAYLWKVAAALGPQLGPVLLQSAPYQKKDLGLLREFVAATITGAGPDALGRPRRAAFELQHPSWDDDEVDQVLVEAGCARCIADKDDGSARTPAVGAWAYLRLRRDDYSAEQLAAWLGRLRATGATEAFVFFKHEDTARGPEMAEELVALAADAAPLTR